MLRRRSFLLFATAAIAIVAVACGSAASNDAGGGTAPPDSTAEPESPADLARRFGSNWSTDFSKSSIDFSELLSGGPGKDGIPAIDNPQFVSIAEADDFLAGREPVIAVELNGDARAYPIQILIWHEIANDTVGGVPVTVTFCPLCNSAIVFEREFDGVVYDFGVSGLLRKSDLVMFDRQTESWWQQFTGEAIVGELTGTLLDIVPTSIVSWDDFKATHPDGQVLSRDTGFVRRYGVNPYAGYDTIGSSTIFRVNEFDDGRLDAKERVLTVEIDGDAVAFPFSELTEHVVLETDVAGQVVVAFWQPGTLSPLDESFIIGSANVGAAAAYSPIVDGERLTFEARGQEIVDTQTGSVWNVLGLAVSGPMEGTMLEPVLSANHFWFSWSVFQPETLVIRGSG